MKLKYTIIIFCLIPAILMPPEILFSQTAEAKPTRQSSMEAFSQGDYEKAYVQFRELLLIYNKDPQYKYYSGVCLVKLNREPAEAISLLQQAIKTAGSVKPLPPDGLFYLARAQQMSGKFEEAIKNFNAYAGEVGKKTSQEMEVPVFLEQCRNLKGQITGSNTTPGAKPVSGSKTEEAVKIETAIIAVPAQKTAENLTSVSGNLPPGYEKVLNEAVLLQFKADSVTEIVNSQKSELNKLPDSQKPALSAAILENEKKAASFQADADKKYMEAKDPGDSKGKTESKNPVVSSESNIVKNAGVAVSLKPVNAAARQDTARLTNSQVGVFSFFDATAKTVSDPAEKIVIDPEVTPGLVYRIQLAVFRKPVLTSFFKGITPVYGFTVEGTDKIVYYAGMFRKNADAVKALATVKNKGFKDSFIVPLSGNKRVSSDRAASLEKEWGSKSFYSMEKSLAKAETDTVTQTLTFRVEVRRSSTPLTEEVVVEMRKMAGDRGMNIMQLQNGEISYLIGNFITFESADEYANLIKRNGYREAQVAAWLGRKEIPVETAKQLFDNLK
jgi:hypothetical protein